jgi:hypothetical protein
MSDEDKAADVQETLDRLQTEVDHLREHLVCVSEPVRRLVVVLFHGEEGEESSIH